MHITVGICVVRLTTNFKLSTTLHWRITYIPCYNQYGKLPQMFDWNTEQKLLKMCGE